MSRPPTPPPKLTSADPEDRFYELGAKVMQAKPEPKRPKPKAKKRPQ